MASSIWQQAKHWSARVGEDLTTLPAANIRWRNTHCWIWSLQPSALKISVLPADDPGPDSVCVGKKNNVKLKTCWPLVGSILLSNIPMKCASAIALAFTNYLNQLIILCEQRDSSLLDRTAFFDTCQFKPRKQNMAMVKKSQTQTTHLGKKVNYTVHY